ncbi:MAG: hypothetical protein JWN44_4138 [Myxococcales bacterium]|nr:hypothetical protein [Myxococcales bacterium]
MRTIDPLRAFVLVGALAAGCATTQAPAQKGAESAGDSVTDSPSEPERSKKKESEPTPPPIETPLSSGPGVIPRTALSQVLDASPGYFLQHVQTEPRFAAGHFRGWRVVSFFPGDTRFAGVDLQAGDVVTRVNGKPIEQPDQFMAVWSELRSSRALVVDLERNGAPRTLRWTIADK